jgi:hypothetical protein
MGRLDITRLIIMAFQSRTPRRLKSGEAHAYDPRSSARTFRIDPNDQRDVSFEFLCPPSDVTFAHGELDRRTGS